MRRFFLAMVIGGLVSLGYGGVTKVARADGGVNTTKVKGHDTDTYKRQFRAGEVITIGVRGDGDTDLDLYIVSPSNQLIAKDDDETDFCLVRFRVPENGVYTIQVVNRGPVSNAYTIAVDGGEWSPDRD